MTKKDAECSRSNESIVLTELDVHNKIFPEEEPKSALEPPIPDGGWGWVVLIASFVMITIAYGIIYFWTARVNEYCDYFDIPLNEATSWFFTCINVVPLLSGPIMGALVARYGCRITTMTAGLVSIVGFVLPTFKTMIQVLFLCSACAVGVAIGALHIVAVVSVALWFDKRRNLAISLVSCGMELGRHVYSPLAYIIAEQDAWKNIFVVVASMLLLSVCGALIKNPEWLEVKQERERTLSEAKMNIEKSSKCHKVQKIAHCFLQLLKKTFDFRKFMGFHLLMFSLSGLIVFASVTLPSYYVHIIQDSTYMTHITSIARCIGFITLGWFGDRSWANVTKIHCACLVILSLIVAACPFFITSFWGMAIICVLFDFFSASSASYTPSILMKILSIDDLPVAYGLILFSQGIGFFFLMFLSELVVFNEPEPSIFYASGAGLAVSGLCVGVIAYTKKSGSTDMSRDPRSDVTAAA